MIAITVTRREVEAVFNWFFLEKKPMKPRSQPWAKILSRELELKHRGGVALRPGK